MHAAPRTVPLEQLATPKQQAAFHHWQKDQAAGMLESAHQRAIDAVNAWNITDLTPLTGGCMSLIARGRLDGKDVVVKVPLLPDVTVSELPALQMLPTAPRVLATHDTALLLEYIDGHAVTGLDADALADAVRALHCAPVSAAVAGRLRPWEALEHELVGKWARKLTGYQPEHGARVLAAYQKASIPVARLERTACHGDLWAKNVMRTRTGDVRIVDPFGLHGPAGWDVALAALSSALDGGEHQKIIDAGEALGIDGIEACLHVAAAVVMSNQVAQDDTGAAQRVLAAAHLT